MMKRKIRFTAILIVLFSSSISLRAQFQIDAELRNRLELRDGYRELAEKGTAPAILIWQRTRIAFSYGTENFKLNFTPQDVRLWGDETIRSSTGVFGDAASLELFESFAEIKLGNLGWVSVGRQQLIYDNQRIVGNRNWNNNGLTYDAILFKLNANAWNIHLAGTWNSLAEASSDNLYPSNRIKSFNFLWLNRQIPGKMNFSLLHVASGVTETDTTSNLHFRQTTGIYIEHNKNDLNICGEAYYQYGKNRSGMHMSAFLISVDASYQIGHLNPGVGMTCLSGNSKTGTDQTTDRLFDILYGARHRFYGMIDYFRNFSSDTRQGGLIDCYFYLGIQLSKSLSLGSTGHYFRLSQTNSAIHQDKKLGYENDLLLKFKFSDYGNLESGYMFFLPTKSLETIQGLTKGGFSQFFYLQLSLHPTLLK